VIGTVSEIVRVEKALFTEIQRRIPQWRYEYDPAKADVLVQFHSGECADCSHCELPAFRPRWAFAEVAVERGLTRAKWSLILSSRSDEGLIEGFAEALAKSVKARAPWCSIGGVTQFFGGMAANAFEFTLLGQTSHGEREAIPGARIRWRSVATQAGGSQEWTEGATDSRGHFAGPNAASGTWDVEVCAAGYRPIHGRFALNQRIAFPEPELVALPAARPAADRIRVLEPSSVIRVDVDTAVHVRWRVENGPLDPKGWEIRVSLVGCADAMGASWLIHTEPFTKAEGSFTWHATKDVVDWIRANEDSHGAGAYSLDGDLEIPIMVCLYNAGDRKREDDFDEALTMFESCHPFGEPEWIV